MTVKAGAENSRNRGRSERGRGTRQRGLRETASPAARKDEASAAQAKTGAAAPGKSGTAKSGMAKSGALKSGAAKSGGAKSGREDAELQLDNFLPYRLSVLNNMVSRALAEQYQARFGLSIPEWRVMANLGRAAPMSANEVAERTSMDKVKVSRAISRMQKAGLVKRETDARDHRVSSLKLSAKGKRIYDKIAPMALAWEQEFLSVLSEREIAAFDKILGKLDKRIRE